MAGYPLILVAPKVWQKTLYGGVPKGSDPKVITMGVASRLFPSVSLYGPKGGVKDGRADALLLAEYARRMHHHG